MRAVDDSTSGVESTTQAGQMVADGSPFEESPGSAEQGAG